MGALEEVVEHEGRLEGVAYFRDERLDHEQVLSVLATVELLVQEQVHEEVAVGLQVDDVEAHLVESLECGQTYTHHLVELHLGVHDGPQLLHETLLDVRHADFSLNDFEARPDVVEDGGFHVLEFLLVSFSEVLPVGHCNLEVNVLADDVFPDRQSVLLHEAQDGVEVPGDKRFGLVDECLGVGFGAAGVGVALVVVGLAGFHHADAHAVICHLALLSHGFREVERGALGPSKRKVVFSKAAKLEGIGQVCFVQLGHSLGQLEVGRVGPKHPLVGQLL
mmetsp:Transcript_13516/g.29283  ORF Transcript_13516/g.29283 Transcript_13516/m.29283 type:complete len:278 (+) Transcript_13516:690-1523(+)